MIKQDLISKNTQQNINVQPFSKNSDSIYEELEMMNPGMIDNLKQLAKGQIERAIDYANDGWHVFPVNFFGHPDIEDPYNNATTDPEIIKKWWSNSPACNIGILTGPKSGIWVLEFNNLDKFNEELLINKETKIELSDNLIAKGRNGECQMYFKWEESFPICTAYSLDIGLKVIGDGGYVITSPSCYMPPSEDVKVIEFHTFRDPINASENCKKFADKLVAYCNQFTADESQFKSFSLGVDWLKNPYIDNLEAKKIIQDHAHLLHDEGIPPARALEELKLTAARFDSSLPIEYTLESFSIAYTTSHLKEVTEILINENIH